MEKSHCSHTISEDVGMRMKKLLGGESGMILPMSMVMLLVGSIVVVPLLQTVSIGALIAGHASFAESEDFAGDAGAEDAIWNLLYDDLGSSIPNENDYAWYVLGNQINGESIDITVTYQGTNAAWDDLETHTWWGGSGWAGDWSTTGGTWIDMDDGPIQGTHHLEIRSPGGSATRIVDLSGQPSDLRLQFWAMIDDFEVDDNTELRFSPDGSQWDVAHIWDDTAPDETYVFFDIDLTPYTLSSQFHISYVAVTPEQGDGEFYIDDLKIVGPPRYKIESDVGGKVTTVVVSVDGGQASIISWKQ